VSLFFSRLSDALYVANRSLIDRFEVKTKKPNIASSYPPHSRLMLAAGSGNVMMGKE
jgi:hypothetical protein